MCSVGRIQDGVTLSIELSECFSHTLDRALDTGELCFDSHCLESLDKSDNKLISSEDRIRQGQHSRCLAYLRSPIKALGLKNRVSIVYKTESRFCTSEPGLCGMSTIRMA